MTGKEIIEALKEKDELDPYKHDGSYELVQKTVELLGKTNEENLDYKDLNMLYLMTIGTWASGFENKKEKVRESNLNDNNKKKLINLIDEIKQKCENNEYEDTINTMHRYRDAIVNRENKQYQREMVGAYVLFPYDNEEEFRDHPFYKSIDKVNVGAFPFLPGHTDLVREFLDNIIQETSLGNFERNVLPQGTEDYQQTIKFNQDVLVGSLGRKAQLNFCKEKNLYYTPYNSSILSHNLKYVALYQSKEKFNSDSGIKYYGKINDIEIKQRSKINTPYSSSRSTQKYIVFKINEWQKLNQPIQPEGYGVRRYIYTNYMLLKKADTLPELSLQTVKQWRIWLELKRMKKEIKVKLANNNIDDINNIEGFEIDSIKLKIKGEKIIADKNNTESTDWTYQEFLNKPRKVLKEIISDS